MQADIKMNRINAWVCSVTHKHTQRHTQQLGNVVQGLATQKDLPITARVARETLLASMLVLLCLHKVGWYIVVFWDHSMAWNERQGL